MPQGLDLMPLARAVFGHHGSPTEENSPLRLRALFGSAAVRFVSYRSVSGALQVLTYIYCGSGVARPVDFFLLV
jgi:hypothetical protein